MTAVTAVTPPEQTAGAIMSTADAAEVTEVTDAADVANAIYSACYNIGIGGGALLGGIVMRAPALGLANVGWVGAALAALALAVFVWTQKRFQAASDVESSKAA